MKLTNRQLDLVTNMIYTKVTASRAKADGRDEKTFKAKVESTIKASGFYKRLVPVFAVKEIESISITDNVLRKYFPWVKGYTNYSTTSYESLSHFVKKLTNSCRSANQPTPINKIDIENKVLLSMLDAKDLQTLINHIAADFYFTQKK